MDLRKALRQKKQEKCCRYPSFAGINKAALLKTKVTSTMDIYCYVFCNLTTNVVGSFNDNMRMRLGRHHKI